MKGGLGMIVVHVSPSGVREVQFRAPSEFFEDLDLAVWPLVRKELSRLDKKLKRATKKSLERLEGEQGWEERPRARGETR
jgi:hypothetical protein